MSEEKGAANVQGPEEQIRQRLEEQFARGPLAADATHTMFWNVLTENEKSALVDFIKSEREAFGMLCVKTTAVKFGKPFVQRFVDNCFAAASREASLPPRTVAEALVRAYTLIAPGIAWMAVHGNLCLALRHPGNRGPSTAFVVDFRDALGLRLVDWHILTPEQLAAAQQEEARIVRPS
jgi:hypothetical protein